VFRWTGTLIAGLAAVVGYGQSEAGAGIGPATELCRSGCRAEAAAMYRRAVESERAAAHPDPRRIAGWLNELGIVWRRLGRHAEAESAYRESLAVAEQAFGAADPAIAAILTNLAELERLEGRLDEAQESAQRGLAIRQERLAPDSLEIAETLNNLGAILAQRRDFQGAADRYRRALSICEHLPGGGAHGPVPAAILHNLGVADFRLGRVDDAESALRRALEIRERALGPEDPNTLDTLQNLAELNFLRGRLAAAETYYTRSYTACEKLHPGEPGHPGCIKALEGLALVYRSLGRFTEAEKAFSGLIAALESTGAPPDFRVAAAREGLADLYAGEARYSRAALLYGQAAETWEQLGGAKAGLCRALGKYAAALRKLHRETEAVAAERRAADILNGRGTATVSR
jgi:tetratricopeptide (TPR) repeat protein